MTGKRVGLVIGNNYPNSNKELKFAVADAKKMKEILENKDICGFDEVIYLQDGTSKEASSALEKILKKAEDDLVFIYFSGHGKKDFENNLCLLFSDTEEDALFTTSLTFDFITKCMRYPSRKSVVIILDCCYSGAAGIRDTDVTDALRKHSEALKGRSGSGTIIITSTGSTGSYKAREDEKYGHGIFTNFLIEGLEKSKADKDEDGLISIEELYDYAFEKTIENSTQSPKKEGSIEGKIFIGKNPSKVKEREYQSKKKKLLEEFGDLLPSDILGECQAILRKCHKTPSLLEKDDKIILYYLESLLKDNLLPEKRDDAVQNCIEAVQYKKEKEEQERKYRDEQEKNRKEEEKTRREREEQEKKRREEEEKAKEKEEQERLHRQEKEARKLEEIKRKSQEEADRRKKEQEKEQQEELCRQKEEAKIYQKEGQRNKQEKELLENKQREKEEQRRRDEEEQERVLKKREEELREHIEEEEKREKEKEEERKHLEEQKIKLTEEEKTRNEDEEKTRNEDEERKYRDEININVAFKRFQQKRGQEIRHIEEDKAKREEQERLSRQQEEAKRLEENKRQAQEEADIQNIESEKDQPEELCRQKEEVEQKEVEIKRTEKEEIRPPHFLEKYSYVLEKFKNLEKQSRKNPEEKEKVREREKQERLSKQEREAEKLEESKRQVQKETNKRKKEHEEKWEESRGQREEVEPREEEIKGKEESEYLHFLEKYSCALMKFSNLEVSITFTSPSTGMEFVLIPAGEFLMGSDENKKEKPIHKVNIKKPFYLSKYPVTQKQWNMMMRSNLWDQIIMGNNPSHFKGEDRPVEHVSWDGVQKFIKKLNEKEGTDKYRLPSEAEWEYACRAGMQTRYSFGDKESELDEYAWYNKNSGFETHSVGQKKPNPWGLYDMHGNIWEWVQDKWHGNYNDAPPDGSTWEYLATGSNRVIRGGSWYDHAKNCRSASRLKSVHFLEYKYSNLGFRLLKEI